MIERIHLEILSSLAAEGTLTRAAQALYRTQPAITHAIRRLEDAVGAPVWRRKGRRVVLTPVGEYLTAEAQRILADLRRVEEHTEALATGRLGVLRIGVECHPCFHWLTGIVRPYLERRPGVEVDVVQGSRFAGYEALLNRRIDVLITPDPRVDRRLETTPVLSYELVLAVSQSHPLAEKPHVLPRDIASETLYTYPVERARLDIFTQFFGPAGVEPAAVKEVEATEIMVQLVAASRGVCALPDWLLRENALAVELSSVRLGPGGIAKQLCMAIRREDADNEYLADFVEGSKGAGCK